MLSKLIAALQKADLNVTAEEIADTLWLALQIKHQQGESSAITDVTSPQIPTPKDMPLNQQTISSLPSSSSQPETAAHVYLASQGSYDKSASHAVGSPFRSPAGSALPNALKVARALRPLMRRLPSKTAFILNENATIQRMAETHMRLCIPIFDPVPTRWFDIELIVDVGASMQFWKDTITELRLLLERQGAFRNVRFWRLDTNNKERLDIYAGANAEQEQAHTRNPKELLDPAGHRLLLVISDGISPAWHSGKVQELLNMWGQKNLVTLIHMLPQRLWSQTTLEAADMALLYTSQSVISNARLKVQKSLEWFDEDIPIERFLPLPIVTLEPQPLLSWAGVMTGAKSSRIIGAIFEKTSEIFLEEPPTESASLTLPPQKRVQRFRTNASSLARKLAGLLAAAPLPISMVVIRQIQHTMIPEANQVHIAEVFLGGLLEKIYEDTTLQDPNQIEYDFIQGVREELINTVPIPEAHQVLQEVSTFVQDRYGQPRDFQALIVAPGEESSHQGTAIAKGSLPFARLELSALRRFGGAFVSLIDELERQSRYIDEPPYEEEALPNPDIHQTMPIVKKTFVSPIIEYVAHLNNIDLQNAPLKKLLYIYALTFKEIHKRLSDDVINFSQNSLEEFVDAFRVIFNFFNDLHSTSMDEAIDTDIQIARTHLIKARSCAYTAAQIIRTVEPFTTKYYERLQLYQQNLLECAIHLGDLNNQIESWLEYKEALPNPDIHQTISETFQEYSSVTTQEVVSANTSFLSEKWCDFDWTGWLPLNSPIIPTSSGIYRIKAVGRNEIFYIGYTGRNLRERIGDLHRNIMRDAKQMPFNDPHTAAPSLWAWRDAIGIDFECSIFSLSKNFEAIVCYLLWQYHLENGSSTLCNHGRFHPQYIKSSDRKTGRRGYRLPDGQPNQVEEITLPPLQLIATPPERTWMGLAWSESYPLLPIHLQNIVSSCGVYKILDADNAQLLYIGSAKNLKSGFQTRTRNNWDCPNPVFAFSVLPETILDYQIREVENDLIGGYYSQTKTIPKYLFKAYEDEEEVDSPLI